MAEDQKARRDRAFAALCGPSLNSLGHYGFEGDPEDECERFKEAVREAFNAGWAARDALQPKNDPTSSNSA